MIIWAIGNRVSLWQAAEILGVSPGTMRRMRGESDGLHWTFAASILGDAFRRLDLPGNRPILSAEGKRTRATPGTIAPMRDGSDGGYVTAFETESGDRVGR